MLSRTYYDGFTGADMVTNRKTMLDECPQAQKFLQVALELAQR